MLLPSTQGRCQSQGHRCYNKTGVILVLPPIKWSTWRLHAGRKHAGYRLFSSTLLLQCSVDENTGAWQKHKLLFLHLMSLRMPEEASRFQRYTQVNIKKRDTDGAKIQQIYVFRQTSSLFKPSPSQTL